MPTLTVCRGCCCGTLRKHPGIDHDGQLDQLRETVGGTARVRTSDCLDDCAHSNVVVVSPSRAGRRKGGRPVWLERVLSPATVDELTGWVEAGGPGVAETPAGLRRHVYKPSRSARSIT